MHMAVLKKEGEGPTSKNRYEQTWEKFQNCPDNVKARFGRSRVYEIDSTT